MIDFDTDAQLELAITKLEYKLRRASAMLERYLADTASFDEYQNAVNEYMHQKYAFNDLKWRLSNESR